MREQEVILRSDLNEAIQKLVAEGPGPMTVAERIAAQARATAPVGDPASDPHSGAYRAGIIAARTKNGAAVIAQDEKSSWVEFGVPSHNQEAQFILRRAVDALGYEFKKGRGGHE
jgi:hypothetical protein